MSILLLKSKPLEMPMIRIERHANCGNSPKNQWIQELTVALESGQMVYDSLSPDVEWHGVDTLLKGRERVIEAISKRLKPVLIRVDQAISHGKIGMANGEIQTDDGKIRRFCHVFEFANVKATTVQIIRSYE